MSLIARTLKEAVSALRREKDKSDAGDMDALAVHAPSLAGLTGIAAASRNLLQPLYETYVARVSYPVWAISMETASVSHALCTILRPSAILDLGSGFSSVTFRLYAQAAGHECRIHSVDTDLDWLERTGQYLQSVQLSTEGLMLWPEFIETPESYDLILHDLGGALREASLERVLARKSARGMVVLDDMHRQPYAQAAQKACAAAHLRLFSMRSITADQYGRHACLATAA